MATPLPSAYTSTLRKELLEYIRSSERLMYSTIPSSERPLSNEEREIVEYYLEELKAHLLAPHLP